MSELPRFTILVVDDERSNLDVLTYILKTQYNVQVAKSGAAALKRAKEQKPDLILLDIMMPDMNGFEVLTELKAMDETRHIPVIFITGLARVEDEEKGFLLGAVDYIVKPFKNSIVKARVRTHVRIVQQIRTIELLGMIDALTDIPNRRSFDQRLEQEWGRSAREKEALSLLILDVDKFKTYNDTYGHPQGDVLLQSLAQTMTATLKRTSDFAARIGGEEFAIILPGTDLRGALAVGEDLCKNVEAMRIPNPDNTATTAVTVSIGATSTIPEVGSLANDFVACADEALYEAKRTGRNRVCSK